MRFKDEKLSDGNPSLPFQINKMQSSIRGIDMSSIKATLLLEEGCGVHYQSERAVMFCIVSTLNVMFLNLLSDELKSID